MAYINRKSNRLPTYEYSEDGAYFLTTCSKNRENILGKIVGDIDDISSVELSEIGKIVENSILKIPQIYPAISVDNFVIMPNHIHLLLRVDKQVNGLLISAPTMSVVLGNMKSYTSKASGKSIWQDSFHDHVIRNQKDYDMIWQYIENNPKKWQLDCFYKKQPTHRRGGY